MGYLCDFCGEQRAMVFCRSDAASLCLSCDCTVHSANALSRRHSRTLLCERCNSQPAFVRCVEEKASLCHNCDWMGQTGSNIGHALERQAVSCYSGCPSASELSAVWPFLLDSPSAGDSTCEQEMVSTLVTGEASGQKNVEMDKAAVWMEPTASASSAMAKVNALCEDDDYYDNLDIDEIELGIENYEELFGMSLDNPKNLFGKDGIFGMEDMSTSAAEVSSTGGVNVMQPACSNAESADSVISCKTEPNLCFTRQALSFSGLTGENGARDFQDCGVSSMAITGDPPWYPPGPDNSIPSTSRTDAVMRYKEKKKARKFEKKVRYESRKARADVRRRVKGRFIKAGEAYDYDPLSPSKSY